MIQHLMKYMVAEAMMKVCDDNYHTQTPTNTYKAKHMAPLHTNNLNGHT